MDDRDMIIRVKRPGVRATKKVGVGDIPGQDVDPNQNLFLITHGQPGPVDPAEFLPTVPVPGSELAPAEKAKLDNQIGQLLQGLSGIAPFVRRPNWLDPPLIAQPIDSYTDSIIVVPPATVDAVILRIDVPNGAVALLTRFGNDLEAAAAFPQVAWNFFWKSGLQYPTTVWFAGLARSYTWRAFHRKLGEPTCPCPFAMPIILRGPGTWELRATNGDIIAHECEARVMGYQYIVQRTDTKTDISAEFML